jgi:hypothetical protein
MRLFGTRWIWIGAAILVLALSSCGRKSSHQAAQPSPDAALLDAADRNDLAGVQAALKQSANVNARNAKGDTPLILALQRSQDKVRTPVTDALVAAGADICAKNQAGKTAFGDPKTTWLGEERNEAFRKFVGLTEDGFQAEIDTSFKKKDRTSIERLRKFNLAHCEGLWIAFDFTQSRPDSFRTVVEMLGGQDAVDAQGRTPLLRLLVFKYGGDSFKAHVTTKEIVDLKHTLARVEDLLAAGGDPKRSDQAGENALHLLARTRLEFESGTAIPDSALVQMEKAADAELSKIGELVKKLITLGVDPKLRNAKGETPADLLAPQKNADRWSNALRPLLAIQ